MFYILHVLPIDVKNFINNVYSFRITTAFETHIFRKQCRLCIDNHNWLSKSDSKATLYSTYYDFRETTLKKCSHSNGINITAKKILVEALLTQEIIAMKCEILGHILGMIIK
jgi:hypothetical protein